MAMLDAIKTQIKTALINKNEPEKTILRYILGEAQLLEARTKKDVTDEQIFKIIRKTIESNEEVLVVRETRQAGGPISAKHSDKLVEENRILQNLLPTYLSQEEILDFLKPHENELKSLDSEGKAIGMAMKLLKASDAMVNSADVAAVVKKVR